MQFKPPGLLNLLILVAFMAIVIPLSAQDELPTMEVRFESGPIIQSKSETHYDTILTLLEDDDVATKLQIVDQVGDLVYESTEHTLEWNGYNNNHERCEGAFYQFYIEIMTADGIGYIMHGNLILYVYD